MSVAFAPLRLLGIALFAGLLALAAAQAHGLWQQALDRMTAEADQAEALATRLRALAPVAGLDPAAVEARLAALSLPAPSVAQAAAALQDRVKGVVSSASGRLDRLDPLPPQQAGGATLVQLRARFATDTKGLQAVLHGLETGTPALAVRALAVEAGTGGMLVAELLVTVPWLPPAGGAP